MYRTIILVCIALLTFIASSILKKSEYSEMVKISKILRTITIVPIALIVLSCNTIIPANTVGVVWSPFGGVRETALQQGHAFVSPLDNVTQLSTQRQTVTLEDITGQTKDSQYLTFQLDVIYHIDTQNPFKVFQAYKTLDNVNEKFISPTTQRAIESITTSYNVIDILGAERTKVYEEIDSALTDEFTKIGLVFDNIVFVDTDADKEVEADITAEAVATKAIATAEQDQLRAKVEAETARIEAQGIADANKILEQSLTSQVLMDKIIEKWNGKYPEVISDTGLMFDVSTFVD